MFLLKGRPVMSKYMIKDEKVQEEVVEEVDEEEQDRIKYFT